MIIMGVAAARRRMRQHQHIPPPAPRQPLWRLVLGEARWALGQLAREPRVLVALLVGATLTPALLDEVAPGPVLPWPARIVVGLLVGLALARGVWAWIGRRSHVARADRPDLVPAVAATEVVAALTSLVLLGWLAVWAITLVA